MRSSQNLSAQREAAAAAGGASPDWVLASPRSFGTMKEGKVIVTVCQKWRCTKVFIHSLFCVLACKVLCPSEDVRISWQNVGDREHERTIGEHTQNYHPHL